MKETVSIFQELFVAITFERYQLITCINQKFNLTMGVIHKNQLPLP